MNEKVLLEARSIIAGFLRDRRNELGLSIAETAERAGIGSATLDRIENGRFWPGMPQLLKLCHVLELYFFMQPKEADTEHADAMRKAMSEVQMRKRKDDHN